MTTIMSFVNVHVPIAPITEATCQQQTKACLSSLAVLVLILVKASRRTPPYHPHIRSCHDCGLPRRLLALCALRHSCTLLARTTSHHAIDLQKSPAGKQKKQTCPKLRPLAALDSPASDQVYHGPGRKRTHRCSQTEYQ